MTIYDQAAALIAGNDSAGAEKLLAAHLAATPSDARARLALGNLQIDGGRLEDGLKSLQAAAALQPNDYATLLALGWGFKANGDFTRSREYFAAAGEAAQDVLPRANAFRAAAWCSVMLRQPAAGLHYYIRAGIFPPTAEAFLSAPDAVPDAQIEQLSDTAAELLIEVVSMAGHLECARRIGFSLMARGDNLVTRQSLSMTLPSVLRALGRPEEAGALYLKILAAGGYAADYRCSWPNRQLPKVMPDWAAEFRAADRRRFEDSAEPPAPIVRAAYAHTRAGDIVSNTGAVLVAEFASLATGASYRFEYGAAPDRLDQATPWRMLPPPRAGKLREMAHRQCGWVPQSTLMSWVREVPDAATEERPVLRLTGPFSTDRNQLNGIGAHEMLMAFSWHKEQSLKLPSNQPSLAMDGGIPDVRDAEFVFTVRGHAFEHRSASLTFWASRNATERADPFCSQWALTGTTFPDDALESGRWSKVSLSLPSDPRQWTYTGNNPEEQGKRADRYRRLPLDVTLKQQNHPFLLIFALDDELNAPRGHVEIADITAHYRHSSLLSPAAGCDLVSFPPSGTGTALNLTGGVRGFDDALWTSTPAPRFPLVFSWTLPRPVTATHLQVGQHPYWPAKEIELWVGETPAALRLMWKGLLPECRPEEDQGSNTVAYLTEAAPFAFAELRILSGYGAERCGLDSFDIYGNGALFQGDGLPCSASEEIEGLEAGGPVYYRAVLRENDVTTEGETSRIEMPATRAPVIESAAPLVRGKDPRCFKVRANAMGLATDLWAELLTPGGEVLRGAGTPLGCQPTGRHLYYIPRGLPDIPGQMFLCAANAAGVTRLPVAWPISA